MDIKYSRIKIGCDNSHVEVKATNGGGAFIYRRSFRHTHRPDKLTIRQTGKRKITLTGRQLATIERLVYAY